MYGLKPFLRYKLIEHVETQRGWLDDAAANRLALARAKTSDQWLLVRAEVLCQQNQLNSIFDALAPAVKWVNVLLWVVCVVLGLTAGVSVLGSSQEPVNVLWVVLSLLGLPTLTLLLWLLVMLSPRPMGSGGAIGLWLQTLLQRWVKSTNAYDFWWAWHQAVGQTGAQRWLFSMITHGFWLITLSLSVVGMAIAFSLKHYVFLWQTTWLEASALTHMSSFLSALPAQFHLSLPTPMLIEQSSNHAIDSFEARTLWARWLIVVVLLWGVLPRLLLFVLSALRWHQLTARLIPQTRDAYAQTCLARIKRLESFVTLGTPGAPDAWEFSDARRLPESPHAPDPSTVTRDAVLSDRVILGLELAELPDWAQQGLNTSSHASPSPSFTCLGVVDDLASRHRVLHRLTQKSPLKLLILCDANQTPDRGSLRFIQNLMLSAKQTHVFLLNASDLQRVSLWQTALARLGAIVTHLRQEDALRWLQTDSS